MTSSLPIVVQTLVEGSDPAPMTEVVALAWEDRQRARQRLVTDQGTELLLTLPRGTVLQDGDRLFRDEQRQIVVRALPQALLWIRAATPLQLGRVAHQLGNWHRPAQIAPDGTLLAEADDPLQDWLEHMGIPYEPVNEAFHPNLRGHVH